LPTSANRCHAHLSDNLRAMGFKPTRFDPDVWLRLRDVKAGFDYIATHTDDLMIVAQDASHHMSTVRDKHIVNGDGPPSFHLGCDYEQSKDNKWKIGTKSYVEECMKIVIDLLGKKNERDIAFDKVPMSPTLKPELDKSSNCTMDAFTSSLSGFHSGLLPVVDWMQSDAPLHFHRNSIGPNQYWYYCSLGHVCSRLVYVPKCMVMSIRPSLVKGSKESN
jgi:hypothetical protein